MVQGGVRRHFLHALVGAVRVEREGAGVERDCSGSARKVRAVGYAVETSRALDDRRRERRERIYHERLAWSVLRRVSPTDETVWAKKMRIGLHVVPETFSTYAVLGSCQHPRRHQSIIRASAATMTFTWALRNDKITPCLLYKRYARPARVHQPRRRFGSANIFGVARLFRPMLLTYFLQRLAHEVSH